MVLGYLVLPGTTLQAQFISHHNPVYQGIQDKPMVGVQITDPAFQNYVTRLTDARKDSIPGLFPDYSKRQAWNSDESLMILRSASGDAYLFNGQNYGFMRQLDGVGGEDVFWHPSDPDILYQSLDSILYRYRVSSGESEPVHIFSDYTWANTRGEGNLSNDGRYYACLGQSYNYATGEVTFKDLLVYDIQEERVISTHALPAGQVNDFDWISISPLGNFVVVDYADEETGRYHGVEVYDRNLNFLWQKPLGAGHSDLGLDAAGREVLIMDVYEDQSNLTHINKYLLADGTETRLLSVSPFFDLHISSRCMNRPGWALISTFDYYARLTDSESDWLPFEDEVFGLKMDGSGTVERYAHHHSRRYSQETQDSDNSVYFAEPHATVSRTGNRILFGSNWRDRIAEEYSIDAYLIDLTQKITTVEDQDLAFRLYPIPASDQLRISTDLSKGYVKILIANSLGQIIRICESGRQDVTVDISGLSAGLYLCIITDRQGVALHRERFIKE
jgi:hypothetical protein